MTNVQSRANYSEEDVEMHWQHHLVQRETALVSPLTEGAGSRTCKVCRKLRLHFHAAAEARHNLSISWTHSLSITFNFAKGSEIGKVLPVKTHIQLLHSC